MTYLILRKEDLAAEIRRILAEQNRRALDLLGTWQANPTIKVHHARQCFKRARAVLRLIRPAASYVYRVENLFYRDLGRKLAYARDTDAVIDALTLLDARIAGPLAQESLRMLRKGLEQRAARERECAAHDLAGRIDSARNELQAAERRFRDLPLTDLRRKDLRRGVHLTGERCARAFERVRHTQAADDFHAWRKGVKYAYHQTRLMEQLMPQWADHAGPPLGTLADVLGHQHDMVMLEALLQGQVDELNVDVHLRSMRNAVRLARSELAVEAIAMGTRLDGVCGSAEANAVDQGRLN